MDIAPKLISPAIGALIAFVIAKVIKKIKQHRLEKKYPVSGDYISEFEDEENNTRVMHKALVQLTQKGIKVKGSTTLGDRMWDLEGKISDDGYLHGKYVPENPLDKGFGVFLLKIAMNSDMNGIWSGFDSEKNKFQSGRYHLIKKPDLVIKDIKNKQVPAILSLAQRQLGDKYLNTNDLVNYNAISVYAYARNSKKIIGFCIGKIINRSDLYDSIPQLRDQQIHSLKLIDKIGLVSSIAVDDDFFGRGIGSTLVNHCIERLEREGMNVIVATAWKSNRGVHAGSILKKHGFHEELEIKEFWKDVSMRTRFKCPVCGDPPCLCTAVIYTRTSNQL